MSFEEQDRWMSLAAARARGEALSTQDAIFVEAYETANPDAANERTLWASFGGMVAMASSTATTAAATKGTSAVAKAAVTSYHKAIVAKWVLGIGLALVGAGGAAFVATQDAEPEEQVEPEIRPAVAPVATTTAPITAMAPTAEKGLTPLAEVAEPPQPEAVPTRSERDAPALPSRPTDTDSRRAGSAAPPSADEMLEAAQTVLAKGSRGAAISSYQSLIDTHPNSAAGTAAHLTLAELVRADGDHVRALELYDGYLELGGKLRAQAQRGRISSLRTLGRDDAERRAIESYLAEDDASRVAEALRKRLEELGRE